MAEFTSILNIIFIISGGVVTFIILFIFAKRQITRFAVRSRRGPHIPIGTDAKKALKKEIDRRIEAVPRIVHEPRLLNTDNSQYILEPQQPYHYRFKAVDDVKTLEEEIARHDPGLRRHPSQSLRAFLLTSLAAPLDGRGLKLVHQFCDTYEFARHHPGEFGEDEYTAYSRLLMKLIDAARLVRPSRATTRLIDTRPQHPYTALQNLPACKITDDIIGVPLVEATPRDETAV